MSVFYRNFNTRFEVIDKISTHCPPHIHDALEAVLVTRGTLELGIERNLFHMETGDAALVFPGVIHHYQVFDPGQNSAVYLLLSPSLLMPYQDILNEKIPTDPVIRADRLHPDLKYAFHAFRRDGNKEDPVVAMALAQLILARALPLLSLEKKSSQEQGRLVYAVVAYLSEHFQESVSLEKMGKDLGYSPYTISRSFSGIFHMNFNRYLNQIRLNYADGQLSDTDKSITQISQDAGFESERTFHRVFREAHHISPGQYRKMFRPQSDPEERETIPCPT